MCHDRWCWSLVELRRRKLSRLEPELFAFYNASNAQSLTMLVVQPFEVTLFCMWHYCINEVMFRWLFEMSRTHVLTTAHRIEPLIFWLVSPRATIPVPVQGIIIVWYFRALGAILSYSVRLLVSEDLAGAGPIVEIAVKIGT